MERIRSEIRAGMTTVEAETETSDIAEVTDFTAEIEASSASIASPCCQQARKLTHIHQAFVCMSAA
jgi:hypothetical protein